MLKGIKGTAEIIVTEENTAEKMGSGNLPVYATPSMIALMEKAASESVFPHLNEGESTVGTMMNINHVSATPIGLSVRAESELVEVDRKRLCFTVKAFDSAGLIGEGTHERFVISAEKFLARAKSKKS